MSRTAGSFQADGGLKAGSDGTLLTKVEKGSVSVDLASIAASSAADATLTISGAAAGDSVIINAAGLTAGLLLCQAYVSAADTVTVRLYNTTAGAIDEASATWYYTLIKS